MFKLTQSYEITTPISIIYIFEEIKRNQQIQKKNGSFWDLIDYRAFSLSINRIEVQRNLSLLNPFKGLGTIIFQFEENGGETKIKCSIDSYGSWMLFAMLFMMGSFLLMLTALLLLNVDGNYLAVACSLVLMWTFGLGIVYFSWFINLYRLKAYSKLILKELKLI